MSDPFVLDAFAKTHMNAIGEPIIVSYDARNEPDGWCIAVERDPSMHVHSRTLQIGIKELDKAKNEWEKER